MPSLAQLLASHGSILVLDAASSQVQVGLLRAGQSPVWHASAEESGKSIFSGTDACLRQAGLGLRDVAGFVFCEGPGSMLGIRTAAMTIRTWQTEQARPAYRYQSLGLLALELRRQNPNQLFSVIADARRDSWHHVAVGANGQIAALRRVPVTELAAGTEKLFQPSGFRAWATPPRPVTDCAYDVAALFAAHMDEDIFTPTDAPDAFQHEAPEYKKWSAHVHSAATASAK